MNIMIQVILVQISRRNKAEYHYQPKVDTNTDCLGWVASHKPEMGRFGVFTD